MTGMRVVVFPGEKEERLRALIETAIATCEEQARSCSGMEAIAAEDDAREWRMLLESMQVIGEGDTCARGMH